MKLKISRVTRSKENAKNSYNRISKWYDIFSGSSERKYVEIGLRKLNAKLGESVLEIGFGTGHAIISLAQSVGSSGMVYGIDISEKMYDITLARIQRAGLTKRVKLLIGDALKLPLETNFLNAIFMSFTLELFDSPEIPLVLNECLRILQKNGRICVVSLSKMKESLMIKLYELGHKLFPTFLDCRPIYVAPSLQDAGFQIIEVENQSMWGLPIEIVIAKK